MYGKLVASRSFKVFSTLMVVLAFSALMVIGCSAVDGDAAAALAGAESVFTEIKSTFSIANIVTLIASAAGASVGLVLMWFGVRKLAKVLMSAFKTGKIKL